MVFENSDLKEEYNVLIRFEQNFIYSMSDKSQKHNALGFILYTYHSE